MADSFNMAAATASYQFKINHSATKDMAIGKSVTSPTFRVGEHDWAVLYFPRGNKKYNRGDYVSVFLKLKRESVDVSAEFELALLDKKGNVSPKACEHRFASGEYDWGFSSFLPTANLEEVFVKDDHLLLKVSITLKDGSCCTGARRRPAPSGGFPCEIIQKFREENACTDVTFDVDGSRFVAHRLILAAHSPVFKAELFGSMAESNQDQITVNEMMPSVFKAMLDFMYGGSLSAADQELSDDEDEVLSLRASQLQNTKPSEVNVGCKLPTGFLQNLLVAADRYAVEKLKSACENKLVESISLDTVLALLELAEKHSCGYLKTRCLKFVVEKDNPVSLMVREEYVQLMQRYPSLLAELKGMATK